MDRTAFELLRNMEKSWWYRGRARVVHAALVLAHAKKVPDVLDFGAGFGGMRDELARVGQNVYAFEPDAEAQSAARKRGYKEVFSDENIAMGRKYDAIGLFDVVEHIERDKEFLIRANAALRDEGILAITVPAFQFLWSVHDVNHHHFRRYTKQTLRKVLEDAGFVVEYCSYWNMTLFVPAAIMRLLGSSGESSLSMPRWLDSIFFALVRIETLIMRAFSLPFGTGLVCVAKKTRADG